MHSIPGDIAIRYLIVLSSLVTLGCQLIDNRINGSVKDGVIAVSAPPEITNSVLTTVRITPNGNITFDPTDLLFSANSVEAKSIVYQIVTLPDEGELRLNGQTLVVGGEFSQQNVINGEVAYVHLSVREVDDSFSFTVRDILTGTYSNLASEASPARYNFNVTHCTKDQLDLRPFAGGDGSGVLNPFMICNVQQLNQIQSNAVNMGKYFRVFDEIDFTSLTETWVPIGSSANPFVGTFDGASFELSNFAQGYKINQDEWGLFSFIDTGALVKNVILAKLNLVIDKGDNIGGLVGYMNGGTVENCHVYGESSQQSGSLNFADVISTYYLSVGGLVGNSRTGIIKDCTAVLNLSDSSGANPASYYPQRVGGLVGEMYQGVLVSQSFFKGSIMFAKGSSVGGLVGLNSGGKIERSGSVADVIISWLFNGTGSNEIGGLVGRNSYSGLNPAIIEDSYAMGKVQGAWRTGGIAGRNDSSTMDHVFSVTENLEYFAFMYCVAGMAIQNGTPPEVYNGVFWNSETCDRGYGGDALMIEKTTIEMKQKATYEAEGWDFTTVWTIEEGQSYPRLQWE